MNMKKAEDSDAINHEEEDEEDEDNYGKKISWKKTRIA